MSKSATTPTGKAGIGSLIASMLMFPNLSPVGPSNLAPQLASVGLVATLIVVVVFTGYVTVRKWALPVAYGLVVYGVYVTGITLFQGGVVIDNIRWLDMGEPLRAIGVAVAFIVGVTYGSRGVTRSTTLALWVYIIATVGLLVEWLWSLGGLGEVLNGLYIRRGGRFSGVMPSVNYVWLPVLITVLLQQVVSEDDLVDWFRGSLIWLVGLSTLLLAGSRTSIVAFVTGIGAYVAVALALRLYRLVCGRRGGRVKMRGIWLGIGVMVIGVWVSDATKMGSGFTRGYDRMVEVVELGVVGVPAVKQRKRAWQKLPQRIGGAWLVGRGPDGDRISPGDYDNSYLVSVHRYGLVGLMIEGAILFAIVVALFQRSRSDDVIWVASGLSVLVALLVAGMTSSVMYELKTPYLAFAWIGIAIGVRVRSQ